MITGPSAFVRITRTQLAVAGVAFAIIVLSFWYLLRSPLPALNDISRIEYVSSTGKHEIADKHWPAIWESLLPARRDSSPAKWIVMGDLDITLKNGNSYHISLFSVEGVGAFAAGTNFESRTYYRGGNSKQLKQSLDQAIITP
ncbi:MAG: hypothetical protein JNJ77_08645 [Planctomycetia bacterium]|nr:hypothetical protein [Planctomycetia bacterium]